MEENMMTLDAALTWDRTFAICNKPKPDFAGGISSLRNSWLNIPPSPFDTVSLPEVGISLQEHEVVVSFRTTSEIRSAKWLNQTIAEIVRLMWLPRDWNSDNPRQIEPKSIEKILAVLLTILDSDSTPPAVVPTTRGGVQVEWHQNGIDLEIESFNSSKLEYYFSDSKGDKEGTIEDDPAILKQFTSRLKTTSCSPRV
jgi:hypothetical protein